MDNISPFSPLTQPDPDQAESGPMQAFPRVVRLDFGLHAIRVGQLGEPAQSDGLVLPCLQVTSPPSPDLDPVDILTAWDEQGAWIGPEGGTVMLRVLPGGGQILMTLYGDAQASADLLDRVAVHCIDDLPSGHAEVPPPAASEPQDAAGDGMDAAGSADAEVEAEAEEDSDDVAAPQVTAVPLKPGEVAIEISLHMQRFGDAMFPGGVWCGNIGQRHQIEAFAVRGLESEPALAFEYMAFGPAGRKTQWVTDGKLCGTRGRGMPLTGFAVRLTADHENKYDVIYQGAFFDSGVTLPSSNGEPCLPQLADDCLEAIQVRVVERGV